MLCIGQKTVYDFFEKSPLQCFTVQTSGSIMIIFGIGYVLGCFSILLITQNFGGICSKKKIPLFLSNPSYLEATLISVLATISSNGDCEPKIGLQMYIKLNKEIIISPKFITILFCITAVTSFETYFYSVKCLVNSFFFTVT